MKEPISIAGATAGVLTTGVALVAIFVPGLGQAAQLAIIGFGNSLILLGTLVWARRQVTPIAAPQLPIGTPVSTPSGQPDGVVAPA